MADKNKGTEEGSPNDTKAAGKAAKKAAAPEPSGESASKVVLATKSVKIPKLAPKNKARLPRREKKARQKGR